jgi:hypothetical protein
MGRPSAGLPADAEGMVADAASAGSPDREIAALLGVSERTVRRRFGRVLTKKRAERRLALRKAQWTTAMAGNPAMLIWLGKQELEQMDQPQIDLSPLDLKQLTDYELECISNGKLSGITRLRLAQSPS